MTEKEYYQKWVVQLWVAYVQTIKRENWPSK